MTQTYWEQRYQTKDMPWEKGEASPGLVDFLAAHPEMIRGTVCVPGCGTGHDARAWARVGFHAFGFDISAEFYVGDFLHDPPPFRFDWIFEHTLFCAIQPAERVEYVRAVSRWLKPRGQYLAVNYLIPDKDGPPFGTTRAELWRRLSPRFKLLKEWVPRSWPNRTGLELMLWWRNKPNTKPKMQRSRA
jgi:hypothetical protein